MAHKHTVEDFYIFKVGAMWRYFKNEHYSFWMICAYLFFEFVRPQALIPELAAVPWAQLLLLGSLAGAILDPSVKWVGSKGNTLITLFAATLIISIVFAQYPETSQRHIMDFFGWFVIYFLIISIINTRERFYIFLQIFVFAASKIAIGTAKSWIMRGFSFTQWGLMGPAGYFQNSGELAILMLMIFPICFYLYKGFSSYGNKWERYLLLIFTVAPMLTILGASSRGAQVALAGQLLIIFRKSAFKLKPLVATIVICATLYHLLPAEQKDRFANSGDDRTSQQRLFYWEHGWEMMKDFPFTGVGFFNFAQYYEDHYSYDLLYATAQLPHNIFVQVGTDAGMIALILFILIIGYCLIVPYRCRLQKQNNELPWPFVFSGLGMGVFGFLLAGQFVTVGYYPFLWIHFATIVSLKNCCFKESSSSKTK